MQIDYRVREAVPAIYEKRKGRRSLMAKRRFSLIFASLMLLSAQAANHKTVYADDMSVYQTTVDFSAEANTEPEDAEIDLKSEDRSLSGAEMQTESISAAKTENVVLDDSAMVSDDLELIVEDSTETEYSLAEEEPDEKKSAEENTGDREQEPLNLGGTSGLIEDIQVLAEESADLSPGIEEAPELLEKETKIELVWSDNTSEYKITTQEKGYYQLAISDFKADSDCFVVMYIWDEEGSSVFSDEIYTSGWKRRIPLSANTRYEVTFELMANRWIEEGEVVDPASFQFKCTKTTGVGSVVEIKNMPEGSWDNREVFRNLTSAEFFVYDETGEPLRIENWEAGGNYHSYFMSDIYLKGSTSSGDVFLLQLIGDYIPEIGDVWDNPVPLGPSSVTPLGSYEIALYDNNLYDENLHRKKMDLIGAETIKIEAKTIPDIAKELEPGATFNQEKDQTVFYKYTPAVSGNYVMCAPGGTANIALYDGNFKKLHISFNNSGYDNPELTARLEAGRVYYYEIASMADMPEIQFYKDDTNTAVAVTLLRLPEKREYEIKTDDPIEYSCPDMKGLQLQLSYSDGSTRVLEILDSSDGDLYADAECVYVSTYLYSSDSEGNPDYSKEAWYAETVGIYWVSIQVEPYMSGGDAVFHVPPFRVTYVNPGEHIHLWSEWEEEDSSSTEGMKVTQVRMCELCGDKETRIVEEPMPMPGTQTPNTDTGSSTDAGTGSSTDAGNSAGTGTTAENGTAHEPFIKLNVKSLPLKVKQSTKVVEVEMAEGDSIVSWTSSNKKVATVSASGKIKGRKKGTAKITVTLASGKTASVTVNVQRKKVTTKSIKGVEKKLTIKKGGKYKLKPVLNPLTSQDKLKYTSSNKKIATVDKKGNIKAKKTGTAKITVQSGKKKVVCQVTVK